MIYIPIFMIVVVVVRVAVVIVMHRHKKSAPTITMSWPARTILEAYNDLPLDNRPYDDIENLLKALDIKYNMGRTDRHFKLINPRTGLGFHEWHHKYRNNGCHDEVCPYHEYKDMFDAISVIKTRLREQEHAFRVAGVQNDLNMVEELMNRLRTEEGLINEVTQELVKG